MPRKCIIKTYSNSTSKNKDLAQNVMFHRFSSNSMIRESWIVNIEALANQFSKINENSVICSDHFDLEQYETKPNGTRRLKKFGEPKIFRDVDGRFCAIEISDSFDKENFDPNATSSDIDLPSPEHKPSEKSFDSNATSSDIDLPSPEHKSSEKSFDPNTTSSDIDLPSSEHKPSEKSFDSDATSSDIDLPSLERKSTEMNVDFALPSSTINNPVIGLDVKSVNARTRAVQRIRYPGDMKEINKMSRIQLEKGLILCRKKVVAQAASIKALRRQVRTKDKQVLSLRSLIKELKKKFALSEHAAESVESSFADDILEQLKEGKKTRAYSENVRSFALTLNFYSNAAYQYVRRKFGNHLPSVSTLREWYKNVDGEPGISEESLNILKRRVLRAKSAGKTVHLALMIDEMSIRKQIIWNDSLKKYIGYVDIGIS